MAFFSTNSADYASAISALQKPTYTSKYNDTISSIMDKIVNKEDFSYDFNADPLYQNMKDSYTKMGKEAAMNAAADVSALTGGYGNSYATTAAAQANQQYLTQLNEQIPELANAALNKYQMEVEDMYNQFNMYETEESRQYGMYRDTVSDYYNDLSDLRSGYSTAVSGEQFNQNLALQKAQMAYQAYRDSVADKQWQTELNTSNWWNQANYNLNSLKSSSSSSGGSGSSLSAQDRSIATKSTSNLMNLISKANNAKDAETYLYNQYKKGNITEGDYIYAKNNLTAKDNSYINKVVQANLSAIK